jgi:O-antigen/teichoic acid export membrane protein
MTSSRDALLYFGGMVFQQLVTFFTGIAVARWLGPDSYGVLSLVRNVFAILLILSPLGLDLSLLRHIGQNGESWPRVRSQILALRGVAAVVNGIVVAVTYLFVGNLLQTHLYHYDGFASALNLTLLALPFAADVSIMVATFRGRHRPAAQALVSLYLQPFARSLFIVGFLWVGFGLSGVLTANILGYAIASATLSVVLWRWNKREKVPSYTLQREDATALRSLLGDSVWLASSLLVYGLLKNVDIMILGAYRPSSEVGEYAAVSAIAQIIQFAPQAISQSLGAVVARDYAKGDIQTLRTTLSGYLRSASLITAPIFGGVAVFGPWLDLLFGSKFHFSWQVCAALASAQYISAVLAPMGYSLSMTGRHRLELLLLASGTAGISLACLLVTPYYGAAGLATTIAVGYLATNFARAFLVRRLFSISLGQASDLLPPLLSLGLALVMRHVGEMLLGRNLPALFAIGVIYLASCGATYWFVLFRPAEKNKLRGKIFKKNIGSL